MTKGLAKRTVRMARKKTKTIEEHREYRGALMRKRRSSARDIGEQVDEAIAGINWKRRRSCKGKPEKFCMTYFPKIFHNKFTKDQKTIVRGITDRVDFGGYTAICAERGGGKSSITKCVAGIYGMLYGHIQFLCVIGASAEFALNILADIKSMFERSDALAEDFPEVCIPVRALEGIPQRANGQLCHGKSTWLTWKEREVVFPMILLKGKPSPISGSVIVIRGIDSSIRGIIREHRRPDLVICDDLETMETSQSPAQTKKRKRILQTDVLGLAPPNKRLAVLMLGTIIRRGCLIDQFTDRTKHPEWNGIHQKRLIHHPDSMELWEKFIELRKADQRGGDDTGRTAHAFYLKNRRKMDAGSKVSNKMRFDQRILKDKTQYEVSALEACFNNISDMGLENFNMEFQNEPPEDIADANRLEYFAVMTQINGRNRHAVPSETRHVTAFIDVHQDRLFWCVVAWEGLMIGSVLDYGAEKFDIPIRGTVEEKVRKKQIELAIADALRDRTKQIREDLGHDPDVGHIDAGYLPQAVFAFLRTDESRKWRPSVGGHTGRTGYYKSPAQSKTTRFIGQGYHESWQHASRTWLTFYDPNRFKMVAQEGFRITDGAGSLSLFGNEPSIHKVFSEHISAEYYNPEQRKFITDSRDNHWLDCLAGCCMGAFRLGVKLTEDPAPKKKVIKESARNRPVPVANKIKRPPVRSIKVPRSIRTRY